ncbi:ie [Spodoptera litura granulovirus]|uniref:Ie n=1 Tax=Spodoptera litura granulovirus TaxID=359919 RepID=A5IZK9_9BBAC|nr:ie [Spodoptera litura granulovirus]ABQ51950.1 ie [Spodoptera litura granulovirus]
MEEDYVDDALLTTNDSENEYNEEDDEESDDDYYCSGVGDDDRNPYHVMVRHSSINWNLNQDAEETLKWVQSFSSSSQHLIICHDAMEYVKNVRFPANVYKKSYHKIYGNAYELHINQVKIMITTALLKLNGVEENKYPKIAVHKNKDDAATAYMLQLKTANNMKILPQLVMFFHAFNIINLPESAYNTVTNSIDKFINYEGVAFIKNRYKPIEELVRPKKECTLSPIETLFNAFCNKKYQMRYKEENGLDHDRYIKEYECAASNKQYSSSTDSVTHVKWFFSHIIKTLFNVIPPRVMRLKTFDSTQQTVADFLYHSQLNNSGHVVYHTRAPFTGKEHFRLNCFKMDKTHVWINSMIYESSKLDLIELVKKSDWGIHYIITFQPQYNQKLKQMHNEVMKLVMRYILQRRDFNLLQKDVTIYSKLKFTKIKCNH